MAQDFAAERLFAGKVGQAGVLGERGEADKRVVAPEVSCAARPPGEAGAEQAAMYAQRQLLGARGESAGADNDRKRLDQRRARARIW